MKTKILFCVFAGFALVALFAANIASAKTINLLATSTDILYLQGSVGIGVSNPSYSLQVSGPGTPTVNITGATGQLYVNNIAPNTGSTLTFNSGNVSVTNTLTAGTLSGSYSGTMSAANLSSGAFGSNTGNGNYSFPGTLAVSSDIQPNANINFTTGAGSVNWIYTQGTAATSAGELRLQAGGGSDTYGGMLTLFGAAHASYPKEVRVGLAGGGGVFKVASNGYGAPSATYMVVNSTGVGIGTTGPGRKLDLQGDFTLNGNTYVNTGKFIQWEGGTYPTLRYVNAGDLQIYEGSSGNVLMTVQKTTGNVGIGTTGPSHLLHLYNSAVSDLIFRMENAAASSDDFRIKVGYGDERVDFMTQAGTYTPMTLKNGNVGIGTTNPGEKLHVKKTTATANDITEVIHVQADTSGTYGVGFGPTIGFWGDSSLSDNIELAQIGAVNTFNGDGASGNLVFYTRPNAPIVERMRITNAGNVGIGKTNPATALDVNGTVTATAFSGSYSGTISAANTSAGAFGANTGGGNYSFPASVGIGTTSPAAGLDITRGSYPAENWSGGWANNLRLTAGNYPALRLFATNSNKTAMIGNNDDGGLWFAVNGTGDVASSTAVIIANTGNVGIGTTGPAAQLDIHSPSATGNIATLLLAGSKDSTDADIATISTFNQRWNNTTVVGQIAFRRDGGDERSKIVLRTGTSGTLIDALTVDRLGNVGIGTTSPGQKLDVNGNVQIGHGNYLKINITDLTNAAPVYLYGDTYETHITTNTNGSPGVGYGVPANTAIASWKTMFGGSAPMATDFWKISRAPATAGTPSFVDLFTVLSTGNVGIGTTGPGHKLDVNGNINVVSTGNYKIGGERLVTQDTYAYFGNLDNGSMPTKIVSGGAAAITILTTGNVGIGTTTPGGKLTIANGGTADVIINTTAGAYSGIKYQQGGTTYAQSYFDGNHFILTNDYVNGAVILKSGGGVEGVRLTSAGNVGIGTTGPTEKLDVRGRTAIYNAPANDADATLKVSNAYGSGQMIFLAAGTDGAVSRIFTSYNITEGDLVLGTYSNRNNQLYLKTNGNVGIGTTNPQNTLHVKTSSAVTNTIVDTARVEAKTTGTFAAGFGPVITFAGSMTGQDNVDLASIGAVNMNGAGAYGDMVFYTRPNAPVQERMRITSDGNVGIGTTNPSYSLQVSGPGTPTVNITGASGQLYVNNIAPNTGSTVTISGTIRGASYGFGGIYTVFGTDGTGSCKDVNPITGACSCPSGFTSSFVNSAVYSYPDNRFSTMLCWK